MRLTPEQSEAVQKKLAANILAKLNRGETITAREQAILDGQADPRTAVFVRTWDDLAQELNVSRKSLQNWRSREDLRTAPDFPRPRADGRHDPAAWRIFMITRGLNRADEGIAATATPGNEDGEPSKAHWDKCRARVDFERASYNFEVEKDKHLAIDDITVAVGQMLAGFRTALNNLPATAARWVIGLKDFHAIKDKLQEEVDAVLQALGRCDYLETLTADVVAKMFADRDEQFRIAIISATDAAQRELGRLALSDLLQRSLAPPQLPAEPHPTDTLSTNPSLAPSKPSHAESGQSSRLDTETSPEHCAMPGPTSSPPRTRAKRRKTK